jgi:hypothetical protein
MILKSSSARKRRREEMLNLMRQREEEREHVGRLKEVEAELVSKKVRMEDVVRLADQNEELVKLMQESGLNPPKPQSKLIQ